MIPGDAVQLIDQTERGGTVFIRENPGCSYLDIKFPDPPCLHAGQIAVLLELKDNLERSSANGVICWAKIIAPEGIGWVPWYMLKEIISRD